MKIIPNNVQSFDKLIEFNQIYVDKTEYIYKCLCDHNACFLSRPRRFGKSLLLDTFHNIFNGNKELFHDLWIGSSPYEFKQYPVIHLDMVTGLNSAAELKQKLLRRLNSIAASEGIEPDPGPFPEEALEYLIHSLHDKYKERVVVLVDEYDDPISSAFPDLPLADSIRGVLAQFYAKIKSNDKLIRFSLVTGVTRFSLTGLSGGANQLIDLSFDPVYGAICGFTVDELDRYFSDRFPETLMALKSKGVLPKEAGVEELRQMILSWYDGYSWDGTSRVLNPVSILGFFRKQNFGKFWINTSPSKVFLNKFGKFITPIDLKSALVDGCSEEDVTLMAFDTPKALPLLFQTGYLSLDKIEYVDSEINNINDSKTKLTIYKFKEPNNEVKGSLKDILASTLFKKSNNALNDDIVSVQNAIKSRDEKTFTDMINMFFAGLASELYTKKESYFHSLIYGFMYFASDELRTEDSGSGGYADLVALLPGNAHAVVEVKYKLVSKKDDETTIAKILSQAADEALAAIRSKDYGRRYRGRSSELILIGLGVCGKGQVLAKFDKKDS
jgi:hypothetical protein